MYSIYTIGKGKRFEIEKEIYGFVFDDPKTFIDL